MNLSLIVAMTRCGVIGRGGQLPWRLSADLKRFKSLTMGHHLLMGRKTFESLGRVLPGRTSIVISRQAGYCPPAGVLVAGSLDAAVALAAGDNEAFVIGGGEIYALALPLAARLYVTWVEAEVEGDTRFPAVDWSQWRAGDCQPQPTDAKNELPATFCRYERILA